MQLDGGRAVLAWGLPIGALHHGDNVNGCDRTAQVLERAEDVLQTREVDPIDDRRALLSRLSGATRVGVRGRRGRLRRRRDVSRRRHNHRSHVRRRSRAGASVLSQYPHRCPSSKDHNEADDEHSSWESQRVASRMWCSHQGNPWHAGASMVHWMGRSKMKEHEKVWLLMGTAYAIPLVGISLAMLRQLLRRRKQSGASR